jgi:MFS family permease
MAFAQHATWLFIARALDGITAGNIPVALAVISDTTEPKDRAKGFGIIGASFGFGFTFGPAISALTLHMGLSAPFVVAGCIALVALFLTAALLPETNMHKGAVVSRHVFDFRHLFHALIDPAIGKTLVISFLVTLAFSIYVYAFQPMSVEILHLSAQQIAVVFTIMGIVGLVSQGAIIPKVIKAFGERQVLVGSLITSTITFSLLFVSRSFPLFITVVLAQAFANGFANPVIQALLSREADSKSQGSIMGVNASYQSIGQIIGPVIGGALSTLFIPLPFLAAAATIFLAAFLSGQILHKHLKHQSLI